MRRRKSLGPISLRISMKTFRGKIKELEMEI
jgi:hypothetical protein